LKPAFRKDEFMASAESLAPPAASVDAGPKTPWYGGLTGDLLIYAGIAAMVGGAWLVSRSGLFKAGDDVGYWLGVAGGVMMLLLFSYPLRKHLKFFHRWGKVKWWFWVHMLLGVGGPMLILLHSTFRVDSINAGVAFYSMWIVAGSGVIGRFLFIRINKGLRGEAQTLRELQVRAGLDKSEAESRLAFAPAVEARLRNFEKQQLDPARGAWTFLYQSFALPLLQWIVYFQCRAELKAPLAKVAKVRGSTPTECAARQRRAQRLVRKYISGVVRVAQFGAYQRLFALWHVAHVPFVYLLVVTAIAHVIAVHIY
jgi:hypothetical protein